MVNYLGRWYFRSVGSRCFIHVVRRGYLHNSCLALDARGQLCQLSRVVRWAEGLRESIAPCRSVTERAELERSADRLRPSHVVRLVHRTYLTVDGPPLASLDPARCRLVHPPSTRDPL